MKPLRPIVFLDLDDVLCISEQYTSGEMLWCYRQQRMDYPELWAGLVDASAAANLRCLHDEFIPLYVISSSWATYLDREQMCDVLTRTRLSFVSENLHDAWMTPRGRSTARNDEIEYWLDEYRTVSQAFLVIDDMFSGSSLLDSPLARDGQVVLCRLPTGFTAKKFNEARAKLRRQLTGDNALK